MERQEDGTWQPIAIMQIDRDRPRLARTGQGAYAPGGASPRPEPGAGSAGPGAAQRRRLS
jgi:hypothetical protein